MSKSYYRNNRTGNYGVLEGGQKVFPNQSSYLKLRLLNAVEGMIDLSHQYENVTAENLVEVSREEVQRVLLGF
jgi:hypothetical protein